MYCTNCGEKSNQGEKFCFHCGNSFTGKDVDEKQVVNSEDFLTSRNIKQVLLIIIAGVIIYGAVQFSNKKEKTTENVVDPFVAQQQLLDQKLEEVQKQSELEAEELKKEIANLKNKTTTQVKNQQVADNRIAELKEEIKSTATLQKEDYTEQSNVVLDSIAKVMCFLNNDKIVSGSGSVWSVGDKYYLITNRHVLEDANRDDENCIISIARDWNAVAEDMDKAYADDNLLIYNLDLSYNYWDIDGFDFAVTEIFEEEQSLTFLEDIAMATNEEECHENISVGEKVKIVGFPYTSSFALPTITEGIISSFENIGDVPYYITSAKIEHGNSGGIAVTNDYYCMIGVPTAVVVGDSESLGRILVMTEDVLKEYLDAI